MHGDKANAVSGRGPGALAAAIIALGLAGCAVFQEQPPGSEAELAYCYRTIAEVDCYTTPDPDRREVGQIANLSGTAIWVSRP